MTSTESSALLQIGIALGELRMDIRNLQRSMDQLILILQATVSTPSTPTPVPAKTASKPSMLASLLEKVTAKVISDLALRLAKKIPEMLIPYVLPWIGTILGLGWLGKALLKLIGWT